ncbi:pyridoxal phosphate-dependent aminotransferase family protein [Sulfuricurvum sp.]|uniref:aminotransferase class I/II-fold pyridoxal phosphate-dependent enzyme n=1 Tax=Sulfuricurvum sp. TaxID=2025608 RepID=UPI0026132614|nr:pyridoxal phosphate-dependent aminotransferase family protein [Sulfuricurvum sp.]MDD2265931.1 pyridoxal phosphate-dependent aminotransferase family protein [Sulfuricurvum sp.]MDD2782913.1 pyridoxal phosphate-dependent aminotransferase family protein [Sulfuricurvum sp.]
MKNPYENELKALKRAGRFRGRSVRDETLIDAASNDYLGLAHHKELHLKACATLSQYNDHAPKASMLVNGYHPIHRLFEEALCAANGFEAGIVMGSGFNANIGLIEALVRKGDVLLMDEEYHASGVAGARMCEGEVIFFTHNDSGSFKEALKRAHGKRTIVAVEGIYSMGGDLVPREIIELAIEHETILILDEAHSSGVIGEHLMGILDHYGIAPTPLMIKMGTLGKAYGSFGAYVLSSKHISEYLINRAKNVIYATAPSLYDTALAHHSLDYIQSHTQILQEQIVLRQNIILETLGIECAGLIVPIEIGDNHEVMRLQEQIKNELGMHVGAIRQPTVKKAILRLIARLDIDAALLRRACERLTQIWVK